MDGFAATALVRKREPGRRRIPIIALTAHDAHSYRAKCLAADMDDILTKPYTLEECARLLRAWLGGHDERRADAAAMPAPHMDEIAHIDAAAIATLKKLRSGKHADLFAKLVELYRSGSAELLEKLRAAFSERDLSAAAALCHRFAAASANVGALAYGKRLRELEKLCVAGENEKAVTMHDELQAAHAGLLASLERELLKDAA
jgi:CheY-like chemotaxis protein